MSTSFKDMITKPPVVFPLVALFHIIMLLISIITMVQQPAATTEISCLWMLGYTVFWVATTAMRKWGAMGYVLTTAANVVTWYAFQGQPSQQLAYVSNIFLIDIIFSFFVIIYYRRFR